jgi:hypothetical protein
MPSGDEIKRQPDMLIKELQRHFPARMPEWTNALTMFCWGAYILLHPGIFTNPTYGVFVQLAWTAADMPARVHIAENLWGLVAVWVGMLRAGALFVNGAYYRTPLIRVLTSAVSAFVWVQIVIGLWRLGQPSLELVLYSSAVVLDLISAYRASCDAATAELTRRGSVGGVTHGKLGEYSTGGAL